MDDNTFSRLASALSLEERQGLLSKLRSHSRLSHEPLYYEEEMLVAEIDTEAEFSWLPLHKRLWFFILSILSSKAPEKVFKEHGILTLGKKIEKKFPKMYNHRTGMILSGFYNELKELKEAANFFYSALDASVNRSRNDFYSFLGSLVMEDIHRYIEEQANPAVVAERHPDATEKDWRQMALKNMEDAFLMITDEHRSQMYLHVRSLFCLKELSSFPFDRLLGGFHYNRLERGETCYAVSVKEQLVNLNNILVSLKLAPDMAVLQSLFIFMLQRRAGTSSNIDLDKGLGFLLQRAEESLSVIREFNKNVPLTYIIRCSNKEMFFLPSEITGGEDWFVVYRNYWKKQIEAQHSEYIRTHSHQKLFHTSRTFLKGRDFEALENAQSGSNPNGMLLKGAFALSFLRAFFINVYKPDINPIMQIIFNEGEFKQEKDRVEMTWSLNYLLGLGEEVDKLEYGIGPTGLYGERYLQAQNDKSSHNSRDRRMQVVIQKVQADANVILDQAQQACQTAANILSGILGKTPSGKYDTLINITKLTEMYSQLMSGIEESIEKFQTTLALLENINAMETGL